MITIQSPQNTDFTPKGKRAVRTVRTSNGGFQIRWYVGGRIFRKLAVTRDNERMSQVWAISKTTHEIDDFNYVGSRHHY